MTGNDFQNQNERILLRLSEDVVICCDTTIPKFRAASSERCDSDDSSDVPDDFDFPFQPYEIQRDLMREVYRTIQQNKIGFFESPTGTGKSLSLICSTLKWLTDHNDLAVDASLSSKDRVVPHQEIIITPSTPVADIEEKKELPKWMREQGEELLREKERVKREELEEKKKRFELKLSKARKSLEQEMPQTYKKRKTEEASVDEWDEFLLDTADSDGEDGTKSEQMEQNRLNRLKLRQLAKTLCGDSSDEEGEAFVQFMKSIDPDYVREEKEGEELKTRKVFYCSRTHTQLSQFVNEVKRTKYAEKVTVITLGSRMTTCINDDVKKLGTLNRMNDKCLDMIKQKSNDKGKTGCKYYDKKTSRDFATFALSKVQDIEELVHLGERKSMCPYYGTRASIPEAQLIVLPYNTLLHRSTRQSLGIDIRDSVVVLDEAHNIVDAINNMYSVSITLGQLSQACSQLSQYKDKYIHRLAARNLSYIKQIHYAIQQFMKSMNKISQKRSTDDDDDKTIVTEIMTINDFLFKCNIENFNPYQLEAYFKKSEIVKKVNGFSEKLSAVEIQKKGREEDNRHVSSLGLVESLLMSLSNVNKDGRIVIQRNGASTFSPLTQFHPAKDLRSSTIRFMLLNPENHFLDILKGARSVILAGGTMHPVSDFVDQILSKEVSGDKVHLFSCGHIIPRENLLAAAVSRAPNDVNFDFTFKNRSDPKVMDGLGLAVVNVCNVVPDGVVLFFPSYQYEDQVFQYWKKTGVISKIEAKKKFIRELRSANAKVEDTLKEYSDAVSDNFPPLTSSSTTRQTGAILSAVVGGKLSEGINFSDGLGRCIIMIGLPYPNQNDPILQEKMKYINASVSSSGKKANATEYLENLCMKSVNQSIGRSIRHVADYSTILLLDERYSQDRYVQKLPVWIRSSLRVGCSYGQAFCSEKKGEQEKFEALRLAARVNKRK
ncbi:putative ATP-dependent RNA helicase DDX11-like protein 8 [Planoprotostelium fungivorum]|uniref:DNA 5'-3' helicase n=1 Tax=Planoprotostelium fungivorum TaxID=1890364 RepID=A0A2P6N197_9EUKA|nr:putative ATP-dependent RNA helicase DDX11-like protein 8 [Planoprotostelium fungivorum]